MIASRLFLVALCVLFVKFVLFVVEMHFCGHGGRANFWMR